MIEADLWDNWNSSDNAGSLTAMLNLIRTYVKRNGAGVEELTISTL